jgi:hypothetical protein
MPALLLALGLVVGLVSLSKRQAEDPTVKRFLQKRRLGIIAAKPDRQVTRLEAEDGLILAKRFEEKNLEMRFAKLVASLKKGSLT